MYLYCILIIEPTIKLPPEHQESCIKGCVAGGIPGSDLCNGPWSLTQKQAVSRVAKKWYDSRKYKEFTKNYQLALDTLQGDNFYLMLDFSTSDKGNPSWLMNDVDELAVMLQQSCESLGMTISTFHSV